MSFEDEIERRVEEALARIRRVPIAVLVWGPAPASGSALAITREKLRDALIAEGHVVRFSEDLYDGTSGHSLVAQQVAHAEAFDIVFSFPGSPGSIAEIHDFARIPGIGHKIIAFVDQSHNGGYSNQSLIALESALTSRIQLYEPASLPDGVIAAALDQVHRLQELFYMAGRRC